MTRKNVLIALIAVSATLGGYALAQAGSILYLSGKPISTDLIVRNGKVYAPIADIAKGLGMTVTPRADGFAIAPEGGANQVGDQTGKMGDVLSNGQFTFAVTEVIRGAEYTQRFGKGTVKAKPGMDVVTVVCRIKNATDRALQLTRYGGELSALTDTEEHAYSINNTGSGGDIPAAGLKFLPGSAQEFAYVLQIPSGATLKDFVYQLRNAGYVRGKFDFKKTVFRIAVPNGK